MRCGAPFGVGSSGRVVELSYTTIEPGCAVSSGAGVGAGEVEDRLVYREREAAGARFLAAKNNADPSLRIREIKAVAASLQELANRYPRSRYAEGVRSSLTTVRKALTEESRQGG